MIDKQSLVDQVIARLEADLEKLTNAAKEARDYATDSECKSEGKYDTRGLEASYLAGAQAEKSEELAEAISVLSRIKLPEHPPHVANGTLVVVSDVTSGEDDAYFILPAGGGIELETELSEHPTTVITPQSPRGEELVNHSPGDFLDGGDRFISEVI
ncbi:transcription elongation factor [Sulfuriroseicoccus oceanibius]|uniref:Uncharacterized protein n=1 Tax=Sulfuriroseicoccus oceanibius TaxID=2707525 RepID=A0A6B3L7D9_9BACT|nr:transcription elongation factor [Sulfuriroseicoccus oceanibius]QQL45887.1 hypothetical protein G3M56_004710 [Sulfuriroseicoccus oceanibius]